MINFFRKTRKKMADDNKPMKYMRYAIGEIVLVVVGILIALQINNWNNVRQDRKQEKSYLIDIKSNLLFDKTRANESISWNIEKIAVMDSLMQLMNTATSGSDYMEYLVNNSGRLASFATFDPLNTAFDNMTASDNIKIVQNKELRNKLSAYYSYDWEKSPQSVTRINTRNFSRIIKRKLIGDSTYHRNLGEVFQPMINEDITLQWYKNFSKEFRDPNYIEFHNDREAVAAMFIMLPNTIFQSNWIERAAKDIDSMLIMIDKEVQIK